MKDGNGEATISSYFLRKLFFILINKFQSILLYNNLYRICFKIDPLEIF